MYFSNPSEPIFSAMNMFPTQGQQQPMQHFPVTSQLEQSPPFHSAVPPFPSPSPSPLPIFLLTLCILGRDLNENTCFFL